MVMSRITNTGFGVLNVLTLLLGLAAICGSIYIHIHGANATDCQEVLRYPLLIGGLFVALVSTLAIVGSFRRVNVVMYIYLAVTFLLILGLILFTVFALYVTNKKMAQKLHNKYWEYRVPDFSHWLQHYVLDNENWNRVRSCLIDAHVCQNLAIDNDAKNKYWVFKELSPMQSGCCKPPVYCGFTMKNATFWEMAKKGPAEKDRDCRTWNNRQDKLCYDCNSCKGGVLANIRLHWKNLTTFNTIVLVLVTITYILGCCATCSSISESQYDRQRHTAFDP